MFRGDRVSFAVEEDRTAPKLAEVFVSMASTRSGVIVMGVRGSDRAGVGACLHDTQYSEDKVVTLPLRSGKR